jgi:hypothetical protein
MKPLPENLSGCQHEPEATQRQLALADRQHRHCNHEKHRSEIG